MYFIIFIESINIVPLGLYVGIAIMIILAISVAITVATALNNRYTYYDCWHEEHSVADLELHYIRTSLRALSPIYEDITVRNNTAIWTSNWKRTIHNYRSTKDIATYN